MGPILNTILGAGIKIGANLVNAWLEQKRQDQLALAARDQETLKALIENQKAQASDGFVQATRRVLFLSITFTLCYLMIYYAHNPEVSYDMIVPKGDNARWGIFSWFLGGTDFHVVTLTGGLMLSSFMDLCFMVVGFYAIPSKKR
tara:strand:+ start:492 stop:926 length:435 start_codon:yes stop_codon:yes gene_type:complete